MYLAHARLVLFPKSLHFGNGMDHGIEMGSFQTEVILGNENEPRAGNE